ncbi:class I lanthipeptide [Taibaiella koreensis]|uniref:class I lanthipeptide n=1 Tax=Taibaiella koreensis TaxID=1268548 RepID=UPI0013C32BA2|nr:class I lanthipeptide [Taibaiella koreensis]
MKTTRKTASRKMELVKTAIVALNAAEQAKIAGGDQLVMALLPIGVGAKPGSYGCTL